MILREVSSRTFSIGALPASAGGGGMRVFGMLSGVSGSQAAGQLRSETEQEMQTEIDKTRKRRCKEMMRDRSGEKYGRRLSMLATLASGGLG